VSKPLVSIILPLHNAAAFIEETLESCFKQSYTNIEVIVVENGSNDGSYELVKSIPDPRLKLYQIDRASAAKARNYGFGKSNGDYLMFLDADDVLEPHKVAYQIKALQEKPQGWVASCAWAKFENKITEAQIKEQAVWRTSQPLEWLVSASMGGGMMIPGCWLIPRLLIEKVGDWDERLTLHDDGEFMCRVLLAAKGQVFVEDTAVYYRQVNNSLSRQNQSYTAAQSALWVAESFEKEMLSFKDTKTIKQAVAQNYYRVLYEFYPKYPQIIKAAKQHLKSLEVRYIPEVGSENFKMMVSLIGFYNALRVKSFQLKY